MSLTVDSNPTSISSVSSSGVSQQSVPAYDLERLRTLDQRFSRKLIGQPLALSYVTTMLKQICTGFYDDTKPQAVWLFAGPTGVGKTELAKLVAEELGRPLHRYDMSEFQQDHTVSRLLGSPPGYHGNKGQLITALNKEPECVILFDEIEKAHRDISKIFLQLFEGFITSGTGVKASTTRAIIIMTTNLGAELSFQGLSQDDIKSNLRKLFVDRFSAELYGRLHNILVFNSLKEQHIHLIAQKHLALLAYKERRKKDITLTWDATILQVIFSDYQDQSTGARGIQRKINHYVYNTLSANYISHVFERGDHVHLSATNSGQLNLTVMPKKAQHTPTIIRADDGFIYLDQERVTANKLKKKYAIRLPAYEGDSFTKRSVFILPHTDGEGHTYVKIRDGDSSKEIKLEIDEDDENWVLPSPENCARGFLLNLCCEILDSSISHKCCNLVRDIFFEVNTNTLPLNDPLGELERFCLKNLPANYDFVISDILELKEYLNPINVKIKHMNHIQAKL